MFIYGQYLLSMVVVVVWYFVIFSAFNASVRYYFASNAIDCVSFYDID